MNYLLHRQKFPKATAKLPEGLSELMSDISREVLREQPSNKELYKFIADYLDALLTTRQRTFVAKEALESILEASILIGELLTKNGIDYKRASKAATVIQNAFRDYVKRKKEEELSISKRSEFNEFAIFQELVLKCDFREHEMMTIKGVVRIAFRDFFRKYSNILKTAFVCGHDIWPSIENTLKYYANDMPSYEDLNKAATKIQAFYRRHSVQTEFKRKYPCLARRLRMANDEGIVAKQNSAARIIQEAYRKYQESIHRKERQKYLNRLQKEFDKVTNAAIKIQAIYRGFKSRKRKRCKERIEGSKNQNKPSIPITPSQQEMKKLDEKPKHATFFREDAARKIQVRFRKLLARKQVETMNLAAIKIQQLFRKTRKLNFKDEKKNSNYEREENAARILQAAWRDFISRRNFLNEIYNFEEVMDEEEEGAEVLSKYKNVAECLGEKMGGEGRIEEDADKEKPLEEEKIEATQEVDRLGFPIEETPIVPHENPPITEDISKDGSIDGGAPQAVSDVAATGKRSEPAVQEASNPSAEESPNEKILPPESELPAETDMKEKYQESAVPES